LEPLLLNKELIKSLVRQNFSLLFDAINSKKKFGYATCQACKILFISMPGPKWHDAVHEAKTVLELFCL